MENTNDALENPIIFGETYGYTQSTSGISQVVIGTAIKFTPKGYVSLKPIKTTSALYNDVPKVKENSKSVTVKPIHLFPVNLK